MSLSIIVPMLNEQAQLPGLLRHLEPCRQRGCEVLLVDGGSHDGSQQTATRLLAATAGVRLLHSARGRARQMNTGAAAARHDILLFLHADTRLPEHAARHITQALARSKACWGRFDARIDGHSRWLGVIARMMNLRSRWSGIATGDQALFMHRSAYAAVGGYPEQPLMEDIEISRRLRRLSPPACIREPVTTSGRRWDRHGVGRTVLLMWYLRLAYACGVSAESLAARYR